MIKKIKDIIIIINNCDLPKLIEIRNAIFTYFNNLKIPILIGASSIVLISYGNKAYSNCYEYAVISYFLGGLLFIIGFVLAVFSAFDWVLFMAEKIESYFIALISLLFIIIITLAYFLGGTFVLLDILN